MNLVAPFGFYGWGNIGDESTLQGFARLVASSHRKMRVWVASRNPSHTARVEPSFNYYRAVGRDFRRRWAHYSSAACVVPGGTPIMDVLGHWPLSELVPLVQAAETQGKPVIFVGTGTERLQQENSIHVMSEIIAPKVQHWSVRCEHDKERLTEYGVPSKRVTVAADMAWLLEPVSTDFGKRYLQELGLANTEKYVGVNVNSEPFMLKREPRLFEKLGKCLDEVIDRHGYRVLFLCNEVREEESFDKATSLQILASMKRQYRAHLVPNEYWAPQQMMSLIGCCEVTISTRYHFCLFSALQGVPFFALQRSDKVADLCWDLNWPHGTALTTVCSPTLLDGLSEIDRTLVPLKGRLEREVQRMRERAKRSSIALDSLTGSVSQ